ncbi:hypothetical protein ACSD7O_14315 [Methylorubrum extorquens]|uniref:hypothetical protein n=1 Tax=Methylorubrum extorquens TaxID=408 RepID=UPI003F61FBFD
MALTEKLRKANERFRCEHTGGETAPFLREAAEEIDRLAAENVDLRHALGRTRNVLNNMAMEHATGWRSIFARWPIHHEPLRSDARGLLPVIDAALAGPQKASRQWICNGDPEQPSPGAPGQPIATAPVNEEVFVHCGEMRFRAKLVPSASMTMDEQPCDQWQATREGEHPPCWSDGCCWASNEDENASLQPTLWSPAPSLTSKEG